MENPQTSLNEVAAAITACHRCPLAAGRTHAVPGEGSPTARVLFIGEGPGADEDAQGRPFVGRSGKFLREMIALAGLTEADYFIANVVKCRPPNNRDPEETEIETCWPFLEKQIAIINPSIIATLGRHSLGRFLPGYKISAVHGQPKRRQSDGKIIVPLYHPAVALYSASKKGLLINDFMVIKQLLS